MAANRPQEPTWGAPGTSLSVAHQSRTRTVLPPFGVNRLSYRVSPLETRPTTLFAEWYRSNNDAQGVVWNGSKAQIAAIPPRRGGQLTSTQTSFDRRSRSTAGAGLGWPSRRRLAAAPSFLNRSFCPSCSLLSQSGFPTRYWQKPGWTASGFTVSC
jgi:hypothetical protein